MKRTATLDLNTSKTLSRQGTSELNSSTDNFPAPSKTKDAQYGFEEEPPVPAKDNAAMFPRKVTAFEPPKPTDKPASASMSFGFDDTEEDYPVPVPAKQAAPVTPAKAKPAAAPAKSAAVNFEFDDMDEDYPVPLPPKSEPMLAPPPAASTFVSNVRFYDLLNFLQ